MFFIYCRWWVAQHSTQHTVHVGNKVLEDSADTVQKVRAILRFLVGTISNMTIVDQQEHSLRTLDKYMLHLLWTLNSEVCRLLVYALFFISTTHSNTSETV